MATTKNPFATLAAAAEKPADPAVAPEAAALKTAALKGSTPEAAPKADKSIQKKRLWQPRAVIADAPKKKGLLGRRLKD